MLESNAGNGWPEYKQVVLYRLDEHGGKLDHILDRLDHIDRDFNQFRGAARVWGAIAGFVAGLVMQFMGKFFN